MNRARRSNAGPDLLQGPPERTELNHAIIRQPPETIPDCQLTYIGRSPIDPERALQQHGDYRNVLLNCNYTVITLPPVHQLPDSAFVEDAAVVLPEGAILLPLGTRSRAAESGIMLEPLKLLFDRVRTVDPPARIEGGDILRIGKKLFVGLSTRTDQSGVSALEEIAGEWEYEVIPVSVSGSLHLKTAVTSLDEETVLVNPEWIDPAAFGRMRVIGVDESEPFAANVLRLGNDIVVHKGFPETRARLETAGFRTVATDISEFLKAEAGLTCLSLLIEKS